MLQEEKFKFRKATPTDYSSLEQLIILSSELINGQYYESQIVKAAIGNIWIVDEQLILDETYWLAENADNVIVGCGGWSKRSLLFGNNRTTNQNLNDNLLDPDKESARIRAFFVHPDFTRKGIGRELLKICENEALSSGFRSLELVATLSGVKLYSVCGFNVKKKIQIDLGNGIFGEAIEMNKILNQKAQSNT